jgi:Domain of unknown function (DUF4189)
VLVPGAGFANPSGHGRRERAMRKIGLLVLLSAIGGLSLGSISPVQAAGALAIGKCDRNGWTYNYGSVAGARAGAVSNCAATGDDTCHVVATVIGACAAFAVDGDCGANGYATGYSRRAAERSALGYCKSYGGEDCTIRAWVCDGG